jgi:DUF917 family protein
MTLDAETGIPVTTDQVFEGRELAVLLVPQKNLLLGETMYDRELLKSCEETVGREMLRFIPEFQPEFLPEFKPEFRR